MTRLMTAAELAGRERHEIIAGEIAQKASPSGAHGTAQAGIVRGLGSMHGRELAVSTLFALD